MSSPVKVNPPSNPNLPSGSPVNPNRCSIGYLDKQHDTHRNLKSQFSEEDIKFEMDNLEDILKLAEKDDMLKTSRNDLLRKITFHTKGNEEAENKNTKETPNKEGDQKVTEEVSSIRNETQTPVNVGECSPAKGENKNDDQDFSCPDISNEMEDVLDERNVNEQNKTSIPKSVIPPIPVAKTMMKNNIHSTIHNKPVINFKNPFGPHNNNYKPTIVPLPGLEGTLKKKSTNILHNWQSRHFVLYNRKLVYYPTSAMETVSGCLDFDLISVKLEILKEKKQFKIIPVGGQRSFTLKAESEDEAMKWYEAIEKHVLASKGHAKILPKVVKMKSFWKYQMISEEKFLREADTGDILLFRTKNFGATIQRSFTRSEYDHVALLLKYANGELVLFEATAKTGVGLCRWSTFMKSKWHLLYSKMVFRKLHITRNEEVIGNIEKFVRYSVGKKYKVTAKKLLKKKSMILDEDKDNRTFFCSELVAACYKKLGLLAPDISAASYLPGSFSAEKKLDFVTGAKLGDENRINFEI